MAKSPVVNPDGSDVANDILQKLRLELRSLDLQRPSSEAVLLAFFYNEKDRSFENFQRFVERSEHFSCIFPNRFGGCWQELCKIFESRRHYELEEVLGNYEPLPSSRFSDLGALSPQIADLQMRLLGVTESDRLLCAGRQSQHNIFFGVPFTDKLQIVTDDADLEAVAYARAMSLNVDLTVDRDNFLLPLHSNFSGGKDSAYEADKIVYSLCASDRMDLYGRMIPYLDSNFTDTRRTPTNMSLVIQRALSILPEDGKLLLVCPSHYLNNHADESLRKTLIERRLLETIVDFPFGLSSSTMLKFSFMIVSRNNDKIAMIDASDMEMYERRRRMLKLKPDALEKIVAQTLDENHLRFVDYNDVDATNYRLTPSFYCAQRDRQKYENYLKLGDHIKEIKQGLLPYKEKDVESPKKSFATEKAKYLNLGNIPNVGAIDFTGELQEGVFAISKIRAYKLEDGDLLISKSGTTKIAVVSDINGETVVASNNFFVFKLDPEVFDPTFVKIYLSSEEGQEQLQYATSDGVLARLPVDEVKGLMIPSKPLEEQKKIVAEYAQRLIGLIELQNRLQESENELKEFCKISYAN